MSATATIKIFQADGVQLVEPLLTANARHEQELMKSDFISLEWKDSEYTVLPMGAYIIYNGLHYTLFDAYKPENSNGVYVYKPEFQAPAMILAHTPCLLKTKNVSGGYIYQTDWVYTGNIQTIVGHIVEIVVEQIGVHFEPIIQIKSTTSLPASATCTFSGVDVISALNEICTQFGGLDWHIDWDGDTEHGGTLYIGDITAGGDAYIIENGELKPSTAPTPIELAEGGNVQFASVNKNGEAFANYFIVRGGTRNITIKTQSENKVQTDTRLELNPDTCPGSVIDRRVPNSNEPKIQKVLIFDDVYPHQDLYVYNIRKRTRYLCDKETGKPIPASYDGNGNVTAYKKYSVYYMKLAFATNASKTTFTQKLIQDPTKEIVAGQKLMCSFEANEDGTHSALAGREFELVYHSEAQTYPPKASTLISGDAEDTGIEILVGDFEIVFDQDDDFIIPNDNTLEPWGTLDPSKRCDMVVLFNVVMTDDYVLKAQADLYNAADNEISRILTDDNNYTVKSNPIAFNTSNPNLKIGSSVNLTLQNGTIMNTRVIKLVTNIDYPCQQEITIGNAIIKGSTQSIKEDVKSLSAAIDTSETAATTINKMISQLYRILREYDTMFLHKDKPDATPFSLGAETLDVEHQATIGGTATVNALKVFTNAIMMGHLRTDNWNNGGLSDGTGWHIDHEGNAQLNSLEVRSALRVLELVYNRLSAEESEYVFTEGGTIKSVREDGKTPSGLNQYIVEMDKRNPTDFHAFREGDVLRGIVNDLKNLGSGQFYTVWLHVESTNTSDDNNSMVVTMYADDDCPSGHNYEPTELMVVQRWGNSVAPTAETHADARYSAFIDEVNGEYVNRRQSCWYISSTEKRIAMLDKVNHPKISEGNYAAFFGLPFNMSSFKGHPMNPLQPYLYVRGAFLQDIFFIDYLGNIIKQERFRGVWNEYTASSSDPYCVTDTTFDTVYYKQAKWQCLVSRAVNPPSEFNTTEWELLQASLNTEVYRLVPNHGMIKRDKDGYPYVSDLNVTVEKIEGNDVTILPDDNVIMIINGIDIRNGSSIELVKDDGIETVDFILLPNDGAKFGTAQFDNFTFAMPLASTSVSIVSDGEAGKDGTNGKDGKDGARGAILRGPTEWGENIEYQGGNAGDDYQDIVARTVDGQTHFYLCHVTHTSSSANDPHGHSNPSTWSEGTPWQASPTGDFVATKVLFAERAVIENVDIRGTITSETLYVDGSADNKLYIANTGRSVTLAPMENRMVVLPLLDDFEDETGWSIDGYNVPGTHIQIHTEPLQDVCNWAASDITTWNNEYAETLYKLMKYSTLVCADPYQLILGNSRTGTYHSYGGESLWTGDYCQGRFSARGMISRFVLVLPGQTLSLTSSIQTMRVGNKDVRCLVWEVDNASDFSTISMRMVSRRYLDDYDHMSNESHVFQGGNTTIAPALQADWIENFLSYKGLDYNVYNAYGSSSANQRNSMQVVLYNAQGGYGIPFDPPGWAIAAQEKEAGDSYNTRFWDIQNILQIK